jgi:hypothetical protein
MKTTLYQISNGCLEIFKKIITLLTVTVLFLFTFFNLILDAPRTPGSTTSRYGAVQQHVLLAQQHPGTQQYNNMYSWLNNIQVSSSTTTCTHAPVQQHVLLA